METITPADFRERTGSDWQATTDGASAEFETGDFETGARLFAAIAEVADAADHHPDVDIRYGSVTVRLFTHSANALTDKDVNLAQEISAAARDLGAQASL